MKVKLLTGRTVETRPGIMYGQSAGRVIEVPDDEGHRMIERGQAEPVGLIASDAPDDDDEEDIDDESEIVDGDKPRRGRRKKN